jgi:hypothetical protein
MEAGQVEPTEIARMGAFIGESVKQGTITTGAGLKPSRTRTRLRFQGGHCELTEGPYPGSNELLAGFCLLKVADRAEAVRWARRFAAVVGDCELELGPVTEAWDLGLAPRPQGQVPLNCLVLSMANAASEAGTPPSERERRKMGALLEEMAKAGVLTATEGILPSREGTRLQFRQGQKVAAVDGPFAESKELIAGFCVIQVPSKEAALAWAERYGSILTDLEVDVLRLHDQAAFEAPPGPT